MAGSPTLNVHARAVPKLLISLLCAWAASVHAADVYVAFDAQGAALFADRPLDERYRLLFKDLQGDAGPAPAPGRAARGAAPPPAEVRAALERAAKAHGLDYALLHAVAQAESGFDSRAVSPKGAIGLMQLMPATARRYGVPGHDAAALRDNLHRTHVNVDAGSRYLRDLLALFDGRTELALAAYNAGEGAVKRAGNRIPDYRETRDYVARVMGTFRRLQAEAGPAASSWSALPQGARGEGGGQVAVQVFRGASMGIERFERGFAQQP